MLMFSCSVMLISLLPPWLQHARHPCPSLSPRICSNSCPLSWWCYLTISSSAVPFFSLQFFAASGSLPTSQFFILGDRNIGASASASVLPMNIQDWFPLGLTGLISLLSKELSRVLSNTTVQKQQESLRRNGVAIIVNKRVWNAVFGCNLKNDRMISVRFQGKLFNITVIQVDDPTSNAEEAEVERFYEDLQDL